MRRTVPRISGAKSLLCQTLDQPCRIPPPDTSSVHPAIGARGRRGPWPMAVVPRDTGAGETRHRTRRTPHARLTFGARAIPMWYIRRLPRTTVPRTTGAGNADMWTLIFDFPDNGRWTSQFSLNFSAHQICLLFYLWRQPVVNYNFLHFQSWQITSISIYVVGLSQFIVNKWCSNLIWCPDFYN